MSLEEKVGQVFIIGFAGQDLSQGLEQTMKDIKPGGILVFKKNIKNLESIADLNRQAQILSFQNSQTPLFIAIDQEGGKVTRIQTQPGQPSPRALGTTKDQSLTWDLANEIGTILRALGFNMNLAPVLDVSPPNKKTFIGTRSFSGNVDEVSSLSLAFSRGMMAANVMPTAKHFPGTGSIEADPHLSLIKKKMTKQTLLKNHIYPYRRFAKLSADISIMVSHISYPDLDESGVPATFSKKILGEFLRKDLAFEGLIVTDDLLMAGAKIYKTSGDSAIAAFNAGADLLMFAWSKKEQKLAYCRFLEAVKSGEVTEERLNESLTRILHAKFAYFNKSDLEKKEFNPVALTNSKELQRIQDKIDSVQKVNEKTRMPASHPRDVTGL